MSLSLSLCVGVLGLLENMKLESTNESSRDCLSLLLQSYWGWMCGHLGVCSCHPVLLGLREDFPSLKYFIWVWGHPHPGARGISWLASRPQSKNFSWFDSWRGLLCAVCMFALCLNVYWMSSIRQSKYMQVMVTGKLCVCVWLFVSIYQPCAELPELVWGGLPLAQW